MADRLHVGDVGSIFRPRILESGAPLDIGMATVRQLRLRKPDATVATKDCVLTTDGSDGQMDYTTVADDLDQAGLWYAEAYLVLPTGSWTTSLFRFRVDSILS